MDTKAELTLVAPCRAISRFRGREDDDWNANEPYLYAKGADSRTLGLLEELAARWDADDADRLGDEETRASPRHHPARRRRPEPLAGQMADDELDAVSACSARHRGASRLRK